MAAGSDGEAPHWLARQSVPEPPDWHRRLWLHVLLFLVTLFSTTALGARLAFNFANNLPAFDLEHDLDVFVQVFRDPAVLLGGVPYSFTLLLILTAHEFGHWFACVYHNIRASLPYFLPAPTFIGTFGAFIRFRSAVKSRRELFDVGVAGPLAGFAFTIPALCIGLALSKVVPGIGSQGEMQFGTPMLARLIEMWLFPGVLAQDIYLHPVARAAWVGLLATALNLLPVGQLDGGHLIYACFGEAHRKVSLLVVVLLIPLGFVYWPWWVWSVVLFFLGRRHFSVFDSGRLGKGRWQLFYLTILIFVLSFIPVPVQYNSDQGFWP